jgi:CDP-diacylglycerol--glycerol-3-phosphate 3-phosphatidyltransferase
MMDSKKSKLIFVTFLTALRLPMVAAFFVGAVMYSQSANPWTFYISFACLIASAVTDLFDGLLARKWGVVTKFGGFADPLMDKFFYLVTWPLLIYIAAANGNDRHALVLLAMTVIFLSRDQWVSFLRSIGSMYNVSGKANWSGKLRTGMNFPLICCIYHLEESPHQFLPEVGVYIFEAAAFAVNFLTLYIYTRNYWPYLKKSIQSGE